MKRLSAILLALPLVLCGACSEEEETLPQQRERIVSYLTSTHSPTLVDESEVDTESQQAFYTTSGNTVYRYIDNYYDPARPGRTEVTASSKVTITFRAYVFNFANITDSTFPFYSNDPLLKSAYEEMGLTSGGLVLRAASDRHAQRKHNKRPAPCVIGLPPGRRGGGLHDLQHGLWRHEFLDNRT